MNIQRVRWLRMMLALVLGLVTSVGVAWGIYRPHGVDLADWVAYTEDGVTSITIGESREFGNRKLRVILRSD